MLLDLAGVFPILAIPFDTDGQVDEESLRRLVRFEIDAGVNGLGLFGMASEVHALTDEERDRIAAVVMEEVSGRLPVIMGSGSTGIEPAVALSRRLARRGAACLMVMPPYWVKPDPEGVVAYYRAIATAVDIPIQVQDAPHVSGVPLPVPLLARLSREIPHIRYVKVETNPSLGKITQLLELTEGRLMVFGGNNGLYMYEEFRRGALGTMPACEFPDVAVRVWSAFRAGRFDSARTEFYKYLPLIRYGTQPGIAMAVHKEILRLGGIFRTGRVRHPNLALDDAGRTELQEIIGDVDLLALRWNRT